MSWLNRIRDWRRRRELRARLDEELAFHRDELIAEYKRRGYTDAEAERSARRDLGNDTRTREDHREQAGLPWVEEWLRDASLAVRNLTRRPGYAVSMIGLLAVGLAATLTVYVLTDAMLRRELPVARPGELHLVMTPEGNPAWFSRATVERLQEQVGADRVIAYGGDTNVTVQRGQSPAQSARGQLVVGDTWGALEITAAAGRLLTTGDDRIGEGAPVALANYTWAEREFGSAAAAVGQQVRINRQPVEVVGVLPRTFRSLNGVDRVDLFFPAALQPVLSIRGNSSQFASDDRPNDPDWNRENRVVWLETLVRVPTSEAPESVVPAMHAAYAPDRADLVAQLTSPAEREEVERRTWQVEPAPGGYYHQRNAFAATGRMLTALVVSLLILTCANLSGIMLVRTLARHREMGVRLALGAGRWRTCRLAMVEAWVCGVAGAILALILSAWVAPAAARLLAPGSDLPLQLWGWAPVSLLIGVAWLCGLGCALAPAWWLSRLQPLVALQGSLGTGALPQRLGRVLVAVQLAMAVMLVAVAFSLGHEISTVLAKDPGFERTSVLTARFNGRTAGFGDEDLPALYDRLKQTLREVPGVENVGISGTGILAGSRSRSTLFPRLGDQEVTPENYQHDSVDVDYFDTVGLRLVRGRGFTTEDTEDSPPVAVVSQAFAQRIWGTDDVLGERIGFGFEPDEEDMEIVGVVANARINQARDTGVEIFFTPVSQFAFNLRFLAVRVSRDPEAARRMISDALGAAEPGLVFGSWMSLGDRLESNLRGEIASSRLASIVGGVAWLLAACGVGGSLAHLVTLRQKELAVRAALGASPQRLMRGVLRDSLLLGVLGTMGGAALIIFVAYGAPALNWWNASPGWGVGAVAIVGGLIAALAGGWLPARRASRIDPQRMLKAD